MAKTDSDTDAVRQKRIALSVLGVLVVGGGVVAFCVLRAPPQLGTNDEVFKTVDALYTAVRNKDSQQLERCEGRLARYREAGKVPAAAADALDSIIATAKSGKWRPAVMSLYDFMKGQRRMGG
jgi:hypothetical protein